jgi:L-glyceraldehyde 3-phosphate reductase
VLTPPGSAVDAVAERSQALATSDHSYAAAASRYEEMPFVRTGRSGLRLPKISLGLWQNFGAETRYEKSREMVLRSFDCGITHFDLANNYGRPYGSAEETLGHIVRTDLAMHRDELIVATKAGYDMWPGPYGQGGGSRKYVLASLDQSLARLGLDYVDIFYSHREDPETPLDETMDALATAVRQGKALYAGISSYTPASTSAAAKLLREYGAPLLVHQASYSMLNRWVEKGLLDAVEQEGAGCVAFSPLAQGMLTDKYLRGIPDGSRAAAAPSLDQAYLSEENIAKVKALNDIALRRNQTLPQMALSWVLREPRITTALIGARVWSQIEQNLRALDCLEFDETELAEIDSYATDSGINRWKPPLDAPAAEARS